MKYTLVALLLNSITVLGVSTNSAINQTFVGSITEDDHYKWESPSIYGDFYQYIRNYEIPPNTPTSTLGHYHSGQFSGALADQFKWLGHYGTNGAVGYEYYYCTRSGYYPPACVRYTQVWIEGGVTNTINVYPPDSQSRWDTYVVPTRVVTARSFSDYHWNGLYQEGDQREIYTTSSVRYTIPASFLGLEEGLGVEVPESEDLEAIYPTSPLSGYHRWAYGYDDGGSFSWGYFQDLGTYTAGYTYTSTIMPPTHYEPPTEAENNYINVDIRYVKP